MRELKSVNNEKIELVGRFLFIEKQVASLCKKTKKFDARKECDNIFFSYVPKMFQLLIKETIGETEPVVAEK